MNNSDWGRNLAEAHAKAHAEEDRLGRRGPSRIRLPDRGLLVCGTADEVVLTMEEESLDRNMQDDPAAFEAWALALRVWCGVERVVLRLEGQPPPGKGLHFQRLLYRAVRFAEHFPWFSLAEQCRGVPTEAISGSELVLNVGGKSEKAGANGQNSEAELERRLVSRPELKEFCGLTAIARQFPVGLFRGVVERNTRVFPGAGSRIDMIGLDSSGGMWLFELKKKGNIKLGIVSELLLYTWMMQDLLRKRFTFTEGKSLRGDVHPDEVQACRRIEARFIAGAFHPLLDGGRMVAAINAALAGADVPTRFGLIHIFDDGSEGARFTFKGAGAATPGQAAAE